MKYLVLISLIFIGTSTYANGIVGFKNGNNIEITNLFGQVTYHCNAANGVPYTRQYSCSGYLTRPGTHDYLISRAPIDADKVQLVATHETDSTQKKSVGFDSKKSQSKSRINLAVRSLFQRPLLKDGNNLIDYTFEKNKKVVLTGSFNATMAVVEDRQCRPRTVFSHSQSQCDNQMSACDHYFYLENNCQY